MKWTKAQQRAIDEIVKARVKRAEQRLLQRYGLAGADPQQPTLPTYTELVGRLEQLEDRVLGGTPS